MLAMWQESLEVLFILANIYLCSNLVSFTKVLSSLISEASFITRRWRKGVQKEQTDPEYRLWELENPWPSSPASFPVKAFSGIALKENYMVSAGPLWDQVAKWRWYGSFYLPMITFLSQKRNSEGWDWGKNTHSSSTKVILGKNMSVMVNAMWQLPWVTGTRYEVRHYCGCACEGASGGRLTLELIDGVEQSAVPNASGSHPFGCRIEQNKRLALLQVRRKSSWLTALHWGIVFVWFVCCILSLDLN